LVYTDPSGESIIGTIFNVGIFIANTALKASTFGSIQLPGTSPNLGGLIAERLGRGANDGAWNEQSPVSNSGGGLNTGGVYGSGNLGPFVFSLTGDAFKQCMASHANDFSIAGTINHGFNWIFGTKSSSFQDNWFVQAVAGNPITSFVYGDVSSNAGTVASIAPTVLKRGMGTATTYGRRTTAIMALNLAGKGGVPLALGAASSGAKAVIGRVATAAGGFMSLQVSFGVNLGFTALEAAYCASQR
jgi:hypothetical protein